MHAGGVLLLILYDKDLRHHRQRTSATVYTSRWATSLVLGSIFITVLHVTLS
jgi:hypothetical protein